MTPMTGWLLSLPGVLCMQGPESFSVMLADATADYPRNSEGDIIALRDGHLLACWSRFYGGAADNAQAHIAARVSSDGGRTWGEPFVLQENVGDENVMSGSFLRERESRDILLFYGVKNSTTDMKFHCRRSADEGQSWGEPVVVTASDVYHVMNNARVIQLSSGRILAPVEWTPEVWSAREHIRTVMFYSDDGGRSWARAPGEVDVPKRGAMEPGVVELRDGRLLQIIRTQLGQVYKSYSSDGGLTWGEPEPLGVAAPEAPSTIERIPTTGHLVLFYNPTVDLNADHCGTRCPLSVAISRDEGMTWEHTADLETDCTHTYAYLSCTFIGDRALLTYYVSGFPLPGGVTGLSQTLVSLPVSALYGSTAPG
jgi:sialidase-1